jgi:MFS family permease
VIIGLFFAHTRFKPEKGLEASQGMGSEFKEGLRYIRSNSVVLSAILMSALLGFFGIPLVQQIPAVARDILQPLLSSETAIAARTSNLYTAQGIGALAAALMMAYFASTNKNSTLLLGQILFIFPIIVLGLVTNASFAFFLLIFIGWGTVVQLISMNIMIQIRVPNDLRGRVFSVYFWGLQGVAPFGSILVGWIAQTWGVQTALVSGGFACMAGIILVRSFFLQKSAQPD